MTNSLPPVQRLESDLDEPADPPCTDDREHLLREIGARISAAVEPALQLLGELRAAHLRELGALDRTLLKIAEAAGAIAKNAESHAQNLAKLVDLIVEAESDEEKPQRDLEGRPLPAERDQTQSLDRPAKPPPTSLEG